MLICEFTIIYFLGEYKEPLETRLYQSEFISDNFRMKKEFLSIIFFSQLFYLSVFAGETREMYNGSRMMAMGGCSVAVVNDETALLSNPAALGKLRDFYGTLFDPEIDMTNEYTRFYNSSHFTDYLDLASITTAARGVKTFPYHYRQTIFPSFVGKNFGIGYYMSKSLDVQVSTADKLNAYSRDDVGLVLGYNLRMFDGRLKIGFNAKYISRIEITQEDVDLTANPTLTVAALGKEGTGISYDAGIILTAPWALLPTISAVARNVGGATFATSGVRSTGGAGGEPTSQDQDIDVALALFPIHTAYSRSTWTIEYTNMLQTEADSAKKMHLGFEYNLGDTLFLRAGYNQRYWTGGIELATERMQIQWTSYGEEVGTATTPQESRRSMVKFAFRF